jgi:hypothetical protein
MDQWLVRTSANLVAGPYSRDQVCELIKGGQLVHQDEVCAANGFWFFLHEQEEVRKQLGVDMPKTAASEEEVTETSTLAGERTDPSNPAGAHVTGSAAGGATQPGPTLSPAELAYPDLAAMDGAATPENTAVMQLAPRRSASTPMQLGTLPAPTHTHAPMLGATPLQSAPRIENPIPKVTVRSGLEKPAVFRGFAWVLIVLTALVVAAVFRLSRSG